MRRWLVLGMVLLVGSASFMAGWFVAARAAEKREGSLVAVAWGDGRYGPAFYGAYVYAEREEAGYSVHARVRIGPGGDYFHDCGRIGAASSFTEAVRRFGAIDWRDDGLHVGPYFLERARLEAHR